MWGKYHIQGWKILPRRWEKYHSLRVPDIAQLCLRCKCIFHKMYFPCKISAKTKLCSCFPKCICNVSKNVKSVAVDKQASGPSELFFPLPSLWKNVCTRGGKWKMEKHFCERHFCLNFRFDNAKIFLQPLPIAKCWIAFRESFGNTIFEPLFNLWNYGGMSWDQNLWCHLWGQVTLQCKAATRLS